MTTPSEHHRPPLWTGWILLLCICVVSGGCGDDAETNSSETGTNLAETADTLMVGEILRTDDRFSTLVAALDSTRLDSTLMTSGPYTVFAPPNSAFELLPEGTLEVLLTERTDRLRRILAHHILEGRITSDQLAGRSPMTTLHGDTLRVRRDSTLRVGTATVVDNDIPAVNGMIHVVDRVLRPPPSEDE